MTYIAPVYRPISHRRGLSRGAPGMGDVVVPSTSPVAALVAQVNRFGPDAPAAYRFLPAPFPLATVNVTPELALYTLLICQRRAADAYTQFKDAGSQALLSQAMETLGQYEQQVSFVSSHMADLTQVVRNFADSVGLPAGVGPVDSVIPGADTSTVLIVVALAAAAFFWSGGMDK